MFIGGGFEIEDVQKEQKRGMIRLLTFMILTLLIGALCFAAVSYQRDTSPDPSAVRRFERLKSVPVKQMSVQEFKDFCILSEMIEKIIYEECHCEGKSFIDESGINWLKPPSPSELSSFGYSEEKKSDRDRTDRRIFSHPLGLRIGYDVGHEGFKNSSKPHYHRYNEKGGKKNKYLDECGDPSGDGHDRSHLFLNEEMTVRKI